MKWPFIGTLGKRLCTFIGCFSVALGKTLHVYSSILLGHRVLSVGVSTLRRCVEITFSYASKYYYYFNNITYDILCADASAISITVMITSISVGYPESKIRMMINVYIPVILVTLLVAVSTYEAFVLTVLSHICT